MQYQLYNPAVGANQVLQVLRGCLLFLRSFASCSARSALVCCRRAGSGGEGQAERGGRGSSPLPYKSELLPLIFYPYEFYHRFTSNIFYLVLMYNK